MKQVLYLPVKHFTSKRPSFYQQCFISAQDQPKCSMRGDVCCRRQNLKLRPKQSVCPIVLTAEDITRRLGSEQVKITSDLFLPHLYVFICHIETLVVLAWRQNHVLQVRCLITGWDTDCLECVHGLLNLIIQMLYNVLRLSPSDTLPIHDHLPNSFDSTNILRLPQRYYISMYPQTIFFFGQQSKKLSQ